MTSHVDRLSSNETKIAARSVRIAVGAWAGQLRFAWSPPEWVVATSLCQSAGRYPPPHGILKQGHRADSGSWIEVDHYRCGQAFRHFMNLLNKGVYGSAFRRYGKRLRVLPVLEKGEVRARSLRPCERGTSGRWHIHCAIELPSHFDAFALEKLIRIRWAKSRVEPWPNSCPRLCKRGLDPLHAETPSKSEFDGLLDCVMIESLHIQLLTRRRSLEWGSYIHALG